MGDYLLICEYNQSEYMLLSDVITILYRHLQTYAAIYSFFHKGHQFLGHIQL